MTRFVALRGAGRRFGGRTALHPTELEVRADETIALVGSNGAGKSTLLALLAGALEPSSGWVERRPELRVGWAPQRPAHYGKLTARENLELFARLAGERAPRRAVDALLGELELQGERRSGELSTGNRQRLNLAIALIGDPALLLLDEPSAPLDPAGRRRLWAAAAQVRARGGSVVFATQNLEELALLADRVALLVEGGIVFTGSPSRYATEGPRLEEARLLDFKT